MGRYLDIAFFSSGMFLVLFIMLSFTDKDIRLIGFISATAALCVSVILNEIFKRSKRFRKKKRRNAADKHVKTLIYRENEEAVDAVFSLLKNKYHLHSEFLCEGRMLFKEGANERKYALAVIRKYKASPDDILTIWREVKKRKAADKIIFAIPGKADNDVRLAPYKMLYPEIQILERNQLKRLARKYAADIPSDVSVQRVNPIRRLKVYVNRKRALRYIAYALLLGINYVLFGHMLYLVFSSVLAFIAAFSMLSGNSYEPLL